MAAVRRRKWRAGELLVPFAADDHGRNCTPVCVKEDERALMLSHADRAKVALRLCRRMRASVPGANGRMAPPSGLSLRRPTEG